MSDNTRDIQCNINVQEMVLFHGNQLSFIITIVPNYRQTSVHLHRYHITNWEYVLKNIFIIIISLQSIIRVNSWQSTMNRQCYGSQLCTYVNVQLHRCHITNWESIQPNSALFTWLHHLYTETIIAKYTLIISYYC